MKLQTKILSILLPLILTPVFGLGFWAHTQAHWTVTESEFRLLDRILRGFIATQLERRHGLLTASGLEDVPAFVRSYQFETQEDAKRLVHREPGTRLFILSEEGRALFTTSPHPDHLQAWVKHVGSMVDSPDISTRGLFYDSRGQHLFVAHRFEPWRWVVYLTTPERKVAAAVASIQQATLGVAGLAAVLAMLLVFFLSRRFITLPIKTLQEAATRIAARAPLMPIPVRSRDELGALARHMEGMAEAVTQAESRLRHAHDELEDKVALRTRELRRSNADLQQFAYVASHDLREPLRQVTGFLGLLKKRLQNQDNDETQEFLGFALDGARRMDQLIEDLLQYSRVNTETTSLVPVEAEKIVKECLDVLKPRIDQVSAKILVAPLPAVVADGPHLFRLFQNLIENALKYRASERVPEIQVKADISDGMATFSVGDNGIGIDSRYLEKIFAIFQRLHGSDQYSGTGLGLAICKRIAERHGGRIWAESQPGQGSVFFFTLPVAPKGEKA